MTNIVRKGLHPVRMKDGSSYDCPVEVCYIPSSDANKYYIGQAVTVGEGANSTVIPNTGPTLGAAGMPIGSLRTVTAATTSGDGNQINGVIVGIGSDADDNGRANYRKASTTSVVFVQTNPNVVYELPTTSAASTFTVADIGKYGNLSTNNTGSDVTGDSNVILHSTLTSGDTSNQVLVVGLSRNPTKNDLASANVTFEVVINSVTA